MKVRDIMSTNLSTVAPRDSLNAAAEIMKNRNVGCVPVCENKQLCGMVTDRDLVVRGLTQNGHQSLTISEIMSGGMTVVNPDTTVEDAARIMEQQQIRRLPVVENGALVGIVSIGDIATRSDGLKSVDALEHISQS